MKTARLSLSAIVASFLLLITVLPVCGAQEIGVTGTVMSNGTIVQDENGEEYMITDNAVKKQVMKESGKRVKIYGTVHDDDQGRQEITASRFVKIEEAD